MRIRFFHLCWRLTETNWKITPFSNVRRCIHLLCPCHAPFAFCFESQRTSVYKKLRGEWYTVSSWVLQDFICFFFFKFIFALEIFIDLLLRVVYAKNSDLPWHCLCSVIHSVPHRTASHSQSTLMDEARVGLRRNSFKKAIHRNLWACASGLVYVRYGADMHLFLSHWFTVITCCFSLFPISLYFYYCL